MGIHTAMGLACNVGQRRGIRRCVLDGRYGMGIVSLVHYILTRKKPTLIVGFVRVGD